MLSAWITYKVVGINGLVNVLEDFIIGYLGRLGLLILLSYIETKVFSMQLGKSASFTYFPGRIWSRYSELW